MAFAAVVLAALVVFEYGYSWLMLREPHTVRVTTYSSSSALRTSIVFPGFSNPSECLGQAMQRILRRYGPMLVVHYDTRFNFDNIYDAIMAALDQAKGPKELLIYGHSMGGQIGEQFRERYEREGNPYGPIRELLLDCTPGNARSLPTPTWFKAVLRFCLKFYWGGPILALVVALGAYLGRLKMQAPRSVSVDPTLYKRYARRLVWFNKRAWVAQLRFMLSYQPPTQPVQTATKFIYIGAQDPSRDGLVLQAISIPQWRPAYPGMNVILNSSVGHAWPLEQPEAYDLIVRSVMPRRSPN